MGQFDMSGDSDHNSVRHKYVYLGLRSVFAPGQFTVLFGERGREQWKLTVSGRNLRPIYDRLCEHRVRRLRKVDRDFGQEADKQPVVTGILVEEVVEKER